MLTAFRATRRSNSPSVPEQPLCVSRRMVLRCFLFFLLDVSVLKVREPNLVLRVALPGCSLLGSTDDFQLYQS